MNDEPRIAIWVKPEGSCPVVPNHRDVVFTGYPKGRNVFHDFNVGVETLWFDVVSVERATSELHDVIICFSAGGK